jgi:hypothetical protein
MYISGQTAPEDLIDYGRSGIGVKASQGQVFHKYSTQNTKYDSTTDIETD